ncbi:hypothetical protein [Streptomyces sp. CC208A]|uniref:hypothetical protein n=1 Tax=Streptomyces sp. CC208A TaxID=3044573 RepID=UPI0024A8A2C6|nr:hypothetical protein [Streptomyces sp. CC208A]
MALVLLAETVHAYRLLRRGGVRRRTAPTALWCLAGAAPSAALVAALAFIGHGALWTWAPDSFTALCAAAAAGVAVIALRFGAVRVGRRGGPGSRSEIAFPLQ